METPKIVHHTAFTVIGFSQQFCFGEGYEKCPNFWHEEYSVRYEHLFKTMKAESPEEQAVLDNRIGEYAVCQALDGQQAFDYMICGEYKGGFVPENMKLITIPESDWLEFRNRGPLPKSLQELNTFVHQTWLKEHADQYQSLGFDIECYSAGNPKDADYECGIYIPIIHKKSSQTLCGIDCTNCSCKNKCQGCVATAGHPHGGSCVLAECCKSRHQETCDTCERQCELKARLISEFNALRIPGMPQVTSLNALPGFYINMEYAMHNGCKVKFWDDNRIYLGNQFEKADGSGRCFGLTADETHLLVCEYGCNGLDPEIVIYKRRE